MDNKRRFTRRPQALALGSSDLAARLWHRRLPRLEKSESLSCWLRLKTNKSLCGAKSQLTSPIMELWRVLRDWRINTWGDRVEGRVNRVVTQVNTSADKPARFVGRSRDAGTSLEPRLFRAYARLFTFLTVRNTSTLDLCY